MDKPIPRVEFIALIAMMFATIAFSVDAMLPALPEIARELAPQAPNLVSMIVTSFLLGLGIGTFVAGPLADTLGRKPVILAGGLIYMTAAALATFAQSLELLLLARVLQGFGAAGPRIVSMAIVRDLFSGRAMAQIMSLAMMIFMIFPAIAPLLGTGIIALSGWRGIFAVFILFSLISMLWMGLRLPETLPRDARRPLRPRLMAAAVGEMARHPVVRLAIMVQTLCMGLFLVNLSMVQPAYTEIFAKADSFPYWFGAVALISSSASLLNARLVMRLGMRRMVTAAVGGQILLSLAMLMLDRMAPPDPVLFGAFLVWQASLFFLAGLTMGNLNAIAMEPMGHIAGIAASVQGAVATVLASLLAAPVGLLFDGTLRPMAGGVLVLTSLAYLLMLRMGRVEARLPA